MVYTVGTGWFWFYLLAALAAFGITIALFYYEAKVGGVITAVVGIVLIYFAIFAGTHFRVGVNERALLIDTVNQKIIGVRESGIQPKPLIGVRADIWPANKAYQIILDLKPGTSSSTSKDKISLWVDTKLYVDLSNMDLVNAFSAVNGGWDAFYSRYLEPQLMNEIRRTSIDFTVGDHSENRDVWSSKFDENAIAFFSNQAEGFGIRLVPGLTTMSFDFVNDDDAKSFDLAHRSVFLTVQRQNEQAALNIELGMAKTRADMLKTTAQGTIDAWTVVADYIRQQPNDVQSFLQNYMALQSNMEYLRMVSEQKPTVIFPPGQIPMVTMPIPQITAGPAVTETPAPKK